MGSSALDQWSQTVLIDPWPAELSPVFLEAHHLVPVGTQLIYSCLLPVLETTQDGVPITYVQAEPRFCSQTCSKTQTLLLTPTVLSGDPHTLLLLPGRVLQLHIPVRGGPHQQPLKPAGRWGCCH